ncbi:hypothetical protein [Micromonospora sp. HM5-17]|uniref:hypothetical protein n=1 Tax=Micromonospora sp. HM5-17 TaxID=2487710 RepID=UPI000F480D28|nr:hypothetical protein [Micromonospora sp. HM5-17]ROT29688.1 hypothetical protein EF879_18780 [Micromonospora sp. HM5-17]
MSQWFGRLLDWRWDPQTAQHVAWHGGRSHRIVKLDRMAADARGYTPGWHLIEDDEWGRPDIGVRLGSTVDAAKAAAEAWIVCAESDLRQYPRLSIAMSSGCVGYQAYGVRVSIRRDDAGRRFAVHRDDATSRSVGAVVPLFLGRGGATSVRWRAVDPAGELIAGSDTWAGAIGSLVRAVG